MDDQVKTTREHADSFINQIVGGLPEFIGAVLILLVGYVIAKALAVLLLAGGLVSAAGIQNSRNKSA